MTNHQNQQGQQSQSQEHERRQRKEQQPRGDAGALERAQVGNQVWETDAGREQPGLGERIATGEVPPPRHDATIWAYPDRESGKNQIEAGQGSGAPDEQRRDEAEQAREPAGQRGESSPPPQELGNPGTTGNDLDIVGGQPV